MNVSQRPAWSASRAWIAAVGVAVIPLIIATLVDARSNTFIVASLVSCALAAASLATWALLRTRRYRKDFEAHLEQWAGQQAVSRERLRIASDLHDIISHGLGLITLRAASATRLTTDVDSEAATALRDIESISRQASNELRRMMGVLRSDDDAAPLAPVDTLATLDDIVSAASDAGLRVELSLSDVGDLPPSVQVTVCAIVREALTNTARHAGPTTVSIAITRADEETVAVRVQDAGPVNGWQPHPGAGQGLVGMRERVASHAGSITATNSEAGYVVEATIPTGGTS